MQHIQGSKWDWSRWERVVGKLADRGDNLQTRLKKLKVRDGTDRGGIAVVVN